MNKSYEAESLLKEQGMWTGNWFLPELSLPKPQCPIRFSADVTTAMTKDRGQFAYIPSKEAGTGPSLSPRLRNAAARLSNLLASPTQWVCYCFTPFFDTRFNQYAATSFVKTGRFT